MPGLLVTALLGATVLGPAVAVSTPAAASCTPIEDLWIHLTQPATVHAGQSVTVAMQWGVKPIPPNGYDNGTIVGDVRWRISVETGATITSAAEKDPASTDPSGRSYPATISGTTASYDLMLGSSPLTARGGWAAVRLGSTVSAGSKVRLSASIGTYATGICTTDYRPSDNASTVYLTVPGSPKPKPKPSPTVTRTSTAKPTTTATPTATGSATPTATPTSSPTPSPTVSGMAAPAQVPARTGSAGSAVLAVTGAGGVGAVLVGGFFLLHRRRGSRPE